MSKNKSATTTCFGCGEDILSTGNYTMKILPAKRIPQKVQKLLRRRREGIKSPLLQDAGQSKGRFHRYVLERSTPANIMEITCGVCKSISKIKMRKVDKSGDSFNKSAVASKNSATSTPLSKSQKKRQRRSKTPKESNAGLLIPASMLTKKDDHNTKKARMDSDSNQTPMSFLPSNDVVSQSKSCLELPYKVKAEIIPFRKKKQNKAAAVEAIKQKQFHNLRKTLFKSQQNFGSSSKSLQDFLE